MGKKLSLLLAVVAAMSLAITATASASKLTSTAGVLAPVGSVITATGSDVTFTSSLLGATTCKTVTLQLTLTKNDGSIVEASGNNVNPAQEGCINGTKKVITTSFNITNLKTTTSGAGTMSFVTTEDIGELECTYTGTNVPFTYVVGSDVITFTNAAGIVGTPAPCGTAKLDATFTLEIKGVAVILD
jgi:hypothetical protein